MKQLNQQGIAGVIEVIFALSVILVIGLVGFKVFNKNGSGSTTTTHNSTIDSMLKGVNHQLLDTTTGLACSDSRKVCYDGDTYFLKMNYPVPEKLKTIITNLNKGGWLLDDGQPVISVLESTTVATSDTNPNDVPDKDLLFKEPGADRNYGYFSLLNLSLSGQSTIYRGDEGAYFAAFSKSEVQTNQQPYYVLQSALSAPEDYDFGKLLSKIDNNSFILSITVGKKSEGH